MAEELNNFLQFKRGLGYGYMRGEFTLREFDRFLVGYEAGKRKWKRALLRPASHGCERPSSPTWTVRALSLFIRILTPSLFNALIISV